MVAFKNFLKVIELVIKLINTIAIIVTYKQKIRKEKFL